MHALQLWVALPEEQEETAPDFHHYAAEDLPTLELEGVRVRLLIGSAYGTRSAVRTFSPTLFLEVQMPAGSTLPLPEETDELAIYLVSGAAAIDGQPLAQHEMAVIDTSRPASINVSEASRLVVLGGEPLGKRTVWWNLVSSRRELIEKAKQDWRNGHFPQVPGETEFIPLPTQRGDHD